MIMTDKEILRDFNGAKKKSEQVQVLADLNCVSKDEMLDKLRELGVDEKDLKSRQSRKKKVDKTLLEAAATEIKQETEKAESAPVHKMPQTVREILTRALIAKQEQIDRLQAEMVDINIYLQSAKG